MKIVSIHSTENHKQDLSCVMKIKKHLRPKTTHLLPYTLLYKTKQITILNFCVLCILQTAVLTWEKSNPFPLQTNLPAWRAARAEFPLLCSVRFNNAPSLILPLFVCDAHAASAANVVSAGLVIKTGERHSLSPSLSRDILSYLLRQHRRLRSSRTSQNRLKVKNQCNTHV